VPTQPGGRTRPAYGPRTKLDNPAQPPEPPCRRAPRTPGTQTQHAVLRIQPTTIIAVAPSTASKRTCYPKDAARPVVRGPLAKILVYKIHTPEMHTDTCHAFTRRLLPAVLSATRTSIYAGLPAVRHWGHPLQAEASGVFSFLRERAVTRVDAQCSSSCPLRRYQHTPHPTAFSLCLQVPPRPSLSPPRAPPVPSRPFPFLHTAIHLA